MKQNRNGRIIPHNINWSPSPVRARNLNAANNLFNSTTRKRSRNSGFNISNNIHARSKTRKNWKNAGEWAFFRKFSNTYKNIPPTGTLGVRRNANNNYGGYAFKGKPTLFSKNYNSVPWKEEIPDGAEGMYEEYGKKPIAVKYLGKRNSFNVFRAL